MDGGNGYPNARERASMTVLAFERPGSGRERELTYFPHVPDLPALIATSQVRRVLLVGTGEILDLPGSDVRVAAVPAPIAANGAYVFRSGTGTDVMVCKGGAQPADPLAADEAELADGHPLLQARSWFGYLWDQARPVGPAPRFAVGQHVKVAGTEQIARVEEHRRVDGHNTYVISVDGQRQQVGEEGLAPHAIEPDDVATWLRAGSATARELSVGLTVTKLTNPLTDVIYSYLSSKTVFRPYQFRPVLRLLQSQRQRLLIADEVGLGKTIEAGLIWTELEARNHGMNRVLIVCPATLVPKWRSEMRRRFDRELTELDKAGMAQLMALLQSGDEDKPLFGIASLERLRGKKILADLTELRPSFDLVVVDEAHYLRNSWTRSHLLGQALSDWADTLLFLSATPLNLGNEDLYSLLNILVDEEFGDLSTFWSQVAPNRHLNALSSRLMSQAATPRALLPHLAGVRDCELGKGVSRRAEFQRLEALLDRPHRLDWREVAEARGLATELNSLSSVLTRTRKVDVPNLKAVREPHQINVAWTKVERDCYRVVLAWARREAELSGGPPGFAMQMPLRQAASCLPVMRDRLIGRGPSLFTSDPALDDFDDYDPWSEDGTPAHPISDLDAPFARLGSTDTKFDRFVADLETAKELGTGQVLVFSFFRGTLAYLERRLRELGWRARSMHGGVAVPDRQRLIDEFRAGAFDILLSSEVGSEGLDFEFCNVIVNYDLPWNPMKVEQRIGRLDRFGQKNDKIFIFNFHVPGTIETEIFERLYHRINVFRESIGELEPILRDEINKLTSIALDPRLTDEQVRKRMDEFEVALERRRKDLDDIATSDSYLGADSLLIEGFETETRSRGRFVGEGELRILLEESFADGTRSKLRRDAKTGQLLLVGDAELARFVGRHGRSGSGSLHHLTELRRRLNDEEPIPVTFDNDEASQRSVDLLSLRHPITRTAVGRFAERPHGLKRFASVSVEDMAAADGSYLVVVYLARTTGLRPSLELWPIAAHLGTGALDDEVGFRLLAGVAKGTLRDGPPVQTDALLPHLDAIETHAGRTRLRIEQDRRRANEDLVAARIDTQWAVYDGRIRKTEATLGQVSDRNLKRLYQGRIVNLRHKQEDIVRKLEDGRGLALTLHPVAVAVITA